MLMGWRGLSSNAYALPVQFMEQCLRKSGRISREDRVAGETTHPQVRVGEIGHELLRILPLDAQGGFCGRLDRVGVRDFEQDDVMAQLLP